MVTTVAAASGDLVIQGRNGALVSSKSQPGGWHVVKGGRCDCRGYAYRGSCRHLTAVAELASRQAVAIAEVQSWFE
jgi:hypothetical protein